MPKQRIVFDMRLFMKRYSNRGLHEISDLFSSMDVEDLKLDDIQRISTFTNSSMQYIYDEFCVVVGGTE